MRIVTALSLALATLIGASSAQAALSPQQAASRIKAAIMKSPKVADKTGPFREKLAPAAKGAKLVRDFRASNVRGVSPVSNGPIQSHVMIEVGNVVTGKINLRTGKVTIAGVSMVK